jgi:hypothetical protein
MIKKLRNQPYAPKSGANSEEKYESGKPENIEIDGRII